ncbi:hypothetical protein [Streptomyces sp. SID3343]|uniref:serine O-acetyltransferase n=1 Tax=Streptomyces sp. SID3343 TaxID=2690260 RepID=UPI0013715B15|nr:hypothetical protein [Streptomyces sp. SID3343]MYW01772.1 hypothetical protein [Streptomyces sp. SID3343]
MSRPAAHRLLCEVGAQVAEDLSVFSIRDAAARGDQSYIYSGYLSFRAVMAYRLAHALWEMRLPDGVPDRFATQARRISEHFRLTTGIEIHPGAGIGRRFVIDHGSGTLIGEDAEVGDDCYFVQNVVLGARDIVSKANGRPQPRRHPHVGSRVQIGGNVHLFGPVNVGDDCLIDAGARITTDIPAGSRVRVITTIQVSTSQPAPVVHGLACVGEHIVISGSRLNGLIPAILDAQHTPRAALTVAKASGTEIHCTPAEPCPVRPAAVGLLRDGRLVCFIEPAAHLLEALMAGEQATVRPLPPIR